MNNILNNIKIAFFDLDGTLTNSKKILSEKNILALKKLKEKNIYITLISGRCNDYILRFAEDLKCVDYIVSTQGACIYDVLNKKILKCDIIPFNLIKKLSNYCYNHKVEITHSNLSLLKENYILSDTIDIYQSFIICKTKEDVNDLIDFINQEPELYISYISSSYYKKENIGNYSINVNSSITNKGNAIVYLLNYLNIPKEYSICFGDNINDLTMFKECGIKIAMDNAASIVKEIATYVTLSNDNDGVAYFINKYFS